ncbi:hypothetical protein [Bifidobacterium sp. UTBIF-68]|uniref:hypothetical protein n=1 Tax=Bifidobacterium sp. UTBIF-68 TaxID=1465262 RepID=UPI0015E33CDA|nr:hypothetical protein [Bifidobacterium sp. UTBIF-68]
MTIVFTPYYYTGGSTALEGSTDSALSVQKMISGFSDVEAQTIDLPSTGIIGSVDRV